MRKGTKNIRYPECLMDKPNSMQYRFSAQENNVSWAEKLCFMGKKGLKVLNCSEKQHGIRHAFRYQEQERVIRIEVNLAVCWSS